MNKWPSLRDWVRQIDVSAPGLRGRHHEDSHPNLLAPGWFSSLDNFVHGVAAFSDASDHTIEAVANVLPHGAVGILDSSLADLLNELSVKPCWKGRSARGNVIQPVEDQHMVFFDGVA